eukprot:Polyplicarium_translucidae@DN769_c0_g1_i1.p1
MKEAAISHLPGAVVFDLDDTLWEGDIDCGGGPPYAPVKGKDGSVGELLCKGRRSGSLRLMRDALKVLDWVRSQGMKLAVASRSTTPDWAQSAFTRLTFADGTTFTDAFHATQIFNGPKEMHLAEIGKALKLPPQDMVFFDNEPRNIRASSNAGVFAHYVPEGISWSNFLDGLRTYGASKAIPKPPANSDEGKEVEQ